MRVSSNLITAKARLAAHPKTSDETSPQDLFTRSQEAPLLLPRPALLPAPKPAEPGWVKQLKAAVQDERAAKPAPDDPFKVARPGVPFSGKSGERALRKFASYLVGRFGDDLPSPLPTAELWKDWLVDDAVQKELMARRFPASSPGARTESYQVKQVPDLFLGPLQATEAHFIRLPADEVQLKAENLGQGTFMELLEPTPEGLKRTALSADEAHSLPAKHGRLLLVGSLDGAPDFRLTFSGQRAPLEAAAQRLKQTSPARFEYGHAKVHVSLMPVSLSAEQLAKEYQELESVLASAPARRIAQPHLLPVPEAVGETLRIQHGYLDGRPAAEQQFFAEVLAESGDPWTALGATELLNTVEPALREEVGQTFLQMTALSREAGHHNNTVNFSSRDQGRYLSNLVLFASLKQPQESWSDFHAQISPAWGTAAEFGMGGGELGVRQTLRTLLAGRAQNEPVAQASQRFSGFVKASGYGEQASVKLYERLPEMAEHRPQRELADLSDEVLQVVQAHPDIPEEILAEVMADAYAHSTDRAGVEQRLVEFQQAYQDKADPVVSFRLANRLDRETKAGDWREEDREALLAELEKNARLGQLEGLDSKEAVERAFQRLRESLKGEEIGPSIELTEGGIWIGGTWLPVYE